MTCPDDIGGQGDIDRVGLRVRLVFGGSLRLSLLGGRLSARVLDSFEWTTSRPRPHIGSSWAQEHGKPQDYRSSGVRRIRICWWATSLLSSLGKGVVREPADEGFATLFAGGTVVERNADASETRRFSLRYRTRGTVVQREELTKIATPSRKRCSAADGDEHTIDVVDIRHEGREGGVSPP